MRILITNISNPKSKQLIADLSNQGHIIYPSDSRLTQDNYANFIKFNLNNFEATLLALRIANPDEIHHFVDLSYLKSIHLLLAASRVKKVIFYFEEFSEFLDSIAKLCAKEIGYQYESK